MPITTSWKTPATSFGSAVTGDPGTVAWSNLGFERVDNDSGATALLQNTAVRSRLIRVSGFGFAADIPAGSTILGIEVQTKRLATTAARVSDDILYLTDDATVANVTQRIGNSRATATGWPTAYAYEAHGGAADLWDATLTAAVVRAANFGIHFAAKWYSASAGGAQANVDAISMRITFEPPPVTGNYNGTEGDDTAVSSPDYVPALDLNFNSGALPAGVAFTRASAATRFNSAGLIESVASGVPRFGYDPASKELLGLLVEEARTNLVLQSQFASGWTVSGATLTPNDALAPDGTTTAALLTGVSGSYYAYQLATVVSGTTYALSAFVKAGTSPTIGVKFVNVADGPVFTFATGLWSAAGGWTTGAQQLANGWWRIWATCAAGTTSAGPGWVVSGATTCHIWGAQLEAGAFATSYIPTTTATVARAADQPVETGAQFTSAFNPAAGTIVAEIFASALTVGGNKTAFSTHDNVASNNFILSAILPSRAAFTQIRAGGVDGATFNALSHLNGATSRVALAFATNDVACSVNGSAIAVDTSVAIPTGQVRLSIGWAEQYGGLYLNGHVRRIRYYNQRLPNAVLQALTKAITGSAAITEGNDNAVGAGQVKVQGQANITEAGDTAAAAGETGIPLHTPGGRIAAAASSRLSNRTAAVAPSRLANRIAQ